MNIKTAFNFGEKVIIDEDKTMVGTVTGILARDGHTQYEVGWVHSGDAKTAWIDSSRLECFDED